MPERRGTCISVKQCPELHFHKKGCNRKMQVSRKAVSVCLSSGHLSGVLHLLLSLIHIFSIMKARIPKHREFIINFPDSIDNAKANEGWAKLQQIVEDYKKAHNGASVYAPTFIEDCEPEVKKLQEEYGFEYTVEYVQ